MFLLQTLEFQYFQSTSFWTFITWSHDFEAVSHSAFQCGAQPFPEIQCECPPSCCCSYSSSTCPCRVAANSECLPDCKGCLSMRKKGQADNTQIQTASARPWRPFYIHSENDSFAANIDLQKDELVAVVTGDVLPISLSPKDVPCTALGTFKIIQRLPIDYGFDIPEEPIEWVIDFSSTDIQKCKHSCNAPNMEAVQMKSNGVPFVVLTVSVDEVPKGILRRYKF